MVGHIDERKLLNLKFISKTNRINMSILKNETTACSDNSHFPRWKSEWKESYFYQFSVCFTIKKSKTSRLVELNVSLVLDSLPVMKRCSVSHYMFVDKISKAKG